MSNKKNLTDKTAVVVDEEARIVSSHQGIFADQEARESQQQLASSGISRYKKTHVVTGAEAEKILRNGRA